MTRFVDEGSSLVDFHRGKFQATRNEYLELVALKIFRKTHLIRIGLQARSRHRISRGTTAGHRVPSVSGFNGPLELDEFPA